MDHGQGNNSKQSTFSAVDGFWKWFADASPQLIKMYSNREFSQLSDVVNRKLDEVANQLAWEIGPGKRKAYLFTFSSEGNTNLRRIAVEMLRRAPELLDWEFYSSRPPRQPPRFVSLQKGGIVFDTKEWKFIPIEQAESSRIDLVILDEKLACADPKDALNAVSIYLDESLGEDTVELWLGDFKIESPGSNRTRKVYDISEISDYLYWATHRENGPLKKTNLQ